MTLTFRGRSYAAFLFDMDGTMIDSSVVVDRAWRGWARAKRIDEAAVMAAVHGVRAVDTVRRFAPPGTNVEAETAAIFAAELADLDGIVPIAGIAAFVARLDPAHWAVVTSAPRALAERRLGAAGLPLPATMIAAEDVTRGKPDPEGFLLAAERLGIAAADCLVFEDSDAGIAAGRAAGCDVIIIGDHATPPPGLEAMANYEAD